jgi:formylglycine-generating enzyme required for sulfatase activity
LSWEDAQSFLQKLNGLISGLGACLPTAAEWEYACRAGRTDALYTGPIQIVGQRNAPPLDPIAWYSGNCGVEFDLSDGFDTDWPEKEFEFAQGGTRKVRQKAANPWGLYDVLGNVYEWCDNSPTVSGYSARLSWIVWRVRMCGTRSRLVLSAQRRHERSMGAAGPYPVRAGEIACGPCELTESSSSALS